MHRRAADVDVLDRILQRAAGFGDGRLERIQVDHEHIDGVDAVRGQCRTVLAQIAPRQQPAVDLRVQRLDAAVEHLGKAGVVGDLGDWQAAVGEQLRGAAGGQKPDAQRVQAAGEFENAGLVGNGNQCVHGMFRII